MSAKLVGKDKHFVMISEKGIFEHKVITGIFRRATANTLRNYTPIAKFFM